MFAITFSVAKTNVEDESVVTEFVGSLADGVCSDLRQLNLVFSGCESGFII